MAASARAWAMVRAMPLAGCLSPSRLSNCWNFSRSSASSIVSTRRADDRHARGRKRPGQVQRRLPAKLHDHSVGLHPVADVQHVLGRQRLEEQQVAGVVIGTDRFGVRVDHDRLDAHLAQGEAGVAAAIVELDALADAVGPAAQDHDARACRPAGGRFVFVLVGRIEVGRVGLELGGAGVDGLERGHDAPLLAFAANGHLVRAPDRGQLPVGKAGLLGLAQQPVVDPLQPVCLAQPLFQPDDLLQVLEEPGVDVRQLMHLVDRHAALEGVSQEPHAIVAGRGDLRPGSRRASAARSCPSGPCRRSQSRSCPLPTRAAPSGTTP